MVTLMNSGMWVITITLSIMIAVLGIKIYVNVKRQKRKLIEMKHKD